MRRLPACGMTTAPATHTVPADSSDVTACSSIAPKDAFHSCSRTAGHCRKPPAHLSVLSCHSSACRYVEDHTNKLVRTFTGNLTAMLHQVHSFRSQFDTVRNLASSSSGSSGSSRSRLSMMAGASSSVSPSSSSNSLQGEQPASRLSQMSQPTLAQTMSLPISTKSSKQLWMAKIESAIQEQVSGASTTIESTGSNNSEQLQRAAPEQQQAEAAAAAAPTVKQQLVSGLKGGLAAKAAVRRSSGSGGKVLGASDGLEVASCATPAITE